MSIENNPTTINAETFSFDESKFKIRSRALLGAPEIPTMIRVLVKNGIVKTENQAVAILLSVVAVFIGVSVFLVHRSVVVPPAVISPELVSNNQ
ncbi:hypothetical protein H7X65_02800 [Candidatus Parcubacteria bacterium]|nr:hypothetical protein [Candidatus Parcubacteria bacterium]